MQRLRGPDAYSRTMPHDLEHDATTPGFARLAERAGAQMDLWAERRRAERVSAEIDRASGGRRARRSTERARAWTRQVLAQPEGPEFARRAIEAAYRADVRPAAGVALAAASEATPLVLPPTMRWALRTSTQLGHVLPHVAVPVARNAIRRVSESYLTIADAEDSAAALPVLPDGVLLEIDPLLRRPLGDDEARSNASALLALLERPGVDSVVLRLNALLPEPSLWDIDDTLSRLVSRVRPLAAAAQAAGTRVQIAQERFDDLDLGLALARTLLDDPALRNLRLGVTLCALYPDTFEAMQGVSDRAHQRYLADGAPVSLRITKGAYGPQERAEARVQGWPSAVHEQRLRVDEQFKRMLHWVLGPERAAGLDVCVASHNLAELAYAAELAGDRGLQDRLSAEIRRGPAEDYLPSLQDAFTTVRVSAPLVHPDTMDAAVASLRHLVGELGDADSALAGLDRFDSDESVRETHRRALRESVAVIDAEPHVVPESFRIQNRETEWTLEERPVRPVGTTPGPLTRPAGPDAEDGDDASLTQQVLGLARGRRSDSPFETTRVFDTGTLPAVPLTDLGAPGFVNVPGTDPAIAANRAWLGRIRQRAAVSELGTETREEMPLRDAETARALVEEMAVRSDAWGERSAADRAIALTRAALALAAERDLLIEAALSEGGSDARTADAEASEAVDAASYYAAKARELDTIRGARFVPDGPLVVLADGRAPIAGIAGPVLAGLAAGSAVIVCPTPGAARTAAVVCESLWESGIPRTLVTPVLPTPEAEAELLRHAAVTRVVVAGSDSDVRRVLAARPGRPVIGRVDGPSAVIITPSGDAEAAVEHVVADAFARFGGRRGAPRLLLLVGSAGRNPRLRDALVAGTRERHRRAAEAVASDALTTADIEGAELLIPPRRAADRDGATLPGLRWGTRMEDLPATLAAGDAVLDVITVRHLDDALNALNALPGLLAAGLHSRDARELARWMDGIAAGSLHVNRPTTNTTVQRHPFGGWGSTARGAGAQEGGPNLVLSLGGWRAVAGSSSATLHLRGLDSRISALIESAQPALEFSEFDVLRRAALSDALIWGTDYGIVRDAVGLEVERNLRRYLSVPVAVRASAGAALGDTLRVVIAALCARSEITLSVDRGLPPSVRRTLGELLIPVSVESDSEWVERMTHPAPLAENTPGTRPARVRLLGTADERRNLRAELAAAVAASDTPDAEPTVYDADVTHAGRIDLIPFLREQSISIAAVRDGRPDRWSTDVI